jgi:hypothetical protein
MIDWQDGWPPTKTKEISSVSMIQEKKGNIVLWLWVSRSGVKVGVGVGDLRRGSGVIRACSYLTLSKL